MDPADMVGDARQVTALDLLHLHLYLHGIDPDYLQWAEGQLSEEPPYSVQLKQLKVLFTAFRMPWNAGAFREGSFIEVGDPRHGPLVEEAVSDMPEWARRQDWTAADDLRGLFSILLRYRELVYGTLDSAFSFNDGVMEASGLYYYAHWKVGQINQAVRQQMQVIDNLLVQLISPDGKAFTLTELVRDYGYPEGSVTQDDGDDED